MTPDDGAAVLLARIGYTGQVRADAATLCGLYRAWQRCVPYENIDIQLARPISLEPESLVDKFGHRRRGGQCFEINAAFALLLESIGFAITLVEGAADRETFGDERWGGHTVLLVVAGGETWLVDIGLSDPFLEPLRLRQGTHQQGKFRYRLEILQEGVWRAHHHPAALLPSFDFRTTPRRVSEFAARADRHRHDPGADRGWLIVHRHREGRELALRARTVRCVGPDGSKHDSTLTGLDEFADTLADVFGVPLEDLGPQGLRTLWEVSGQQHEAWLESRARAVREEKGRVR
ncbi:arylamine N-acetyltransferase family protein [Streptomyces ochraceiscleroticus]|uniref:Arylamine N-acetyltransferase n=1 Tax=Streptomyces ochraceiscleroticus TaxID=47761 RepID=A0ABW1MJV9_9ACTN|nr:arylamine N-acetyltransferase [Streptomyces ochraceiscleroticus]